MAYRLKQLALGIPIIFITASRKAGLKKQAMDFGAAAFLEKPYEPEVLLEAVSRVFHEVNTAIKLQPDLIILDSIIPPDSSFDVPQQFRISFPN
jgi:FixJ family two-component response regulator